MAYLRSPSESVERTLGIESPANTYTRLQPVSQSS